MPEPWMFLPSKPGRVRFFERRFEARDRLGHELAADVVVGDGRADRVALEREALDERVRVVAQDVAVVAGAGLALVGVADEVLLHRRRARHEAHLHAGREARAAAAADAGLLHLVDDRVARELAAQHFLPDVVAADLAVVLERVRLVAELQRLEADEVELSLRHGA